MCIITPEYRRAAQDRLARLLPRAGTLASTHTGQGASMLTRYYLDRVLLTSFRNHTASRHYDRVVGLVADHLRHLRPPHPSPIREANLIWMAVRRTYPTPAGTHPPSKLATATSRKLSGGKSK